MIERALLARLCRGPASGEELAREAGITRAAVWKRVQALREAGVEIDARPGRGYALARPLELLDARAMAAAMSPEARRQLSRLTVLFDTDSTNAVALREPAPARGCAVWLAERQQAGRGRRGRAWVSPLAAHVYLSVSRRFEGGIAALQGLSLAVGVVACEALRALGFADVGLKWPNDLLARGRKLGGILVEVGGEAAGPVRAVVGLGVNVQMPSAMGRAIEQSWVDLAGLAGGSVSRPMVASALLDALLPALAQFEREGPAPFLARWPRLDCLAGRPVRVACAGEVHEGTALGLSDDGALRLEVGGVERRFHAGEASLRAA
ncbi:bifunctional biotin--[acetyl-CoA-carboxylase] ligase/biotin operon repressor BirA [Arenimonas fontis]|uniref:Bifunctional ligase/repressor BirA n=1 Tax=Arenimonas fontis TaxID=2608255 RepID=A0A5B2Z9T2_9GAMM|nr:bifunctional biotin--[acetyl-CoA-carboxylase] ligase/biotin operon repressor BirA [Arenimonas fontis]KAA2285408.1 bifunctional biotin--[acetyl-CoA-carboxylase] ligase/biotin operon repressor BirA [Arenimonas fontis]